MNAAAFPGRPLPTDLGRVRLLGRAVVVPEPGRCVQCGICSYNCPTGVDTRSFARAGRPLTDPRCILCGSCVARCPRGTLRFEPLASPAGDGSAPDGRSA